VWLDHLLYRRPNPSVTERKILSQDEVTHAKTKVTKLSNYSGLVWVRIAQVVEAHNKSSEVEESGMALK